MLELSRLALQAACVHVCLPYFLKAQYVHKDQPVWADFADNCLRDSRYTKILQAVFTKSHTEALVDILRATQRVLSGFRAGI